ncbi:Mut7-C RNAse domain-containing protein [candidate division CSSED10-310 bacterium]|uniref:Mut7-C RNAse domain-containing protein n=1 Tax=candidate division CSSED10-310 bacterium TaxID=2855610 RepID=A0ABV6YU01_UNCC1
MNNLDQEHHEKHVVPWQQADFRFYEELNDFLIPDKRKKSFQHLFKGNPAIKDVIESLGVPHTEVDLVLVNGQSVSFAYTLKAGDRISVFPTFESLDISSVTKLRAEPLREPKFILDVHLGKCARYLRLLGFDSLYENNYTDPEIVRIALDQKRIILTRDLGLLKIKNVTHGYWVRSKTPAEQVPEILQRFDLYAMMKPFQRCTTCNGLIVKTPKEAVLAVLKPNTKKHFKNFSRCLGCGKVYWKGSHYHQMKRFVDSILSIKPAPKGPGHNCLKK